jgi:hypothetical protein
MRRWTLFLKPVKSTSVFPAQFKQAEKKVNHGL